MRRRKGGFSMSLSAHRPVCRERVHLGVVCNQMTNYTQLMCCTGRELMPDGEWSEPEVFLHWWISCHIRWAVRDYPKPSAGKRTALHVKIQDKLKS